MNKIPIDIVNIIIEFAFKKCEKCNEIKHFTELNTNCRIFEYMSVFDDCFCEEKTFENFNVICKKCIKKYEGNIIIDFGNNSYSWIKDYNTT